MKFLKEEFMEMAKSLYYEVFRGFQSISLLHKTQFPWAFFFFFLALCFQFLIPCSYKKRIQILLYFYWAPSVSALPELYDRVSVISSGMVISQIIALEGQKDTKLMAWLQQLTKL